MSGLRYTLLADGTSDTILTHVINWAIRGFGVAIEEESYADLSRPRPRR